MKEKEKRKKNLLDLLNIIIIFVFLLSFSFTLSALVTLLFIYDIYTKDTIIPILFGSLFVTFWTALNYIIEKVSK